MPYPLLLLLGLLAPGTALAAQDSAARLDLTASWVGYAALAMFSLAYVLVILEEKLHLRKSKPVLLAAGVIWICIAIAYNTHGLTHVAEASIRYDFLEYAELFFFLLVAMTYINAMIDRGVFDALRDWLVAKGYSFRTLFWITGSLAFLISPVADNLTTALIMCAVILAVGEGQPQFIALGCINIVVGANAGGAFSPFGDITTLMVWQKGMLPFWAFFKLFVPALVNFAVPALIMQFALPTTRPTARDKAGAAALKPGGLTIVALFFLTIVTAVSFHNFLHLPPVFGMMLGLAYLKFYDFYLHFRTRGQAVARSLDIPPDSVQHADFDVFDSVARAEWDTLFFFYGVIMAVGGIGFIGYLGMASTYIYGDLGATSANVLVGLMSSIVDNIPVMFAVLTMNPDMPQVQWLLVTLTAGVGGSLLSIGSAAGVALMGQARGHYTFFGHLKWTPAVALGYGASIYVHFLING